MAADHRARANRRRRLRNRALLRFKYQPRHGVIVLCRDRAQQRDVFDRLTGQRLECKVVSV